MEDEGIITNYTTFIDASKLGYTSYRIYLVFERTTPDIEQEIIDYFINNKYTWVVCSLKGRFDFAVLFWVREIKDFNNFWKDSIKKYRKYFREQVFSVYQHSVYKFSFLLLDKYDKADRNKFWIAGGGKEQEVDDLDFQILTLLATNARIPTKELANKLNSSTITINKRIQKMIEFNIIKGFRVNIDFSKLGYYYYKANINLIDYDKRDDIIKYVSSNPHFIILDETIGFADLEINLIVENVNQFYEIMEDISNKFPDTIQNYTHFYVVKLHKWQYFPEK
jgi:DNA-binding Lrp family transcriptional regulator